MWNGRKRLRPQPDTSFHDDEDDVPSKKYLRMRTRTRAPANSDKRKSGLSEDGNSNSFAGNKKINTTASLSEKTNDDRHKSFAGFGAKKRSKFGFNKTSDAAEQLFGGGRRKSHGTSKSFVANTKDSHDGKASQSQDKKEFSKDNKPKHLMRTPRKPKSGPVPSLHSQQTPEFMKIKEDDSILHEKKERKRQRHKIMSRRTARGQPIMRGRIELMLEEIKANMKQK